MLQFITNIGLTPEEVSLDGEFLESINLVTSWGELTTNPNVRTPSRFIGIGDFVRHMERVERVTLDKPIIIRDVLKTHVPQLLDGNHRVIKAVMNKVKKLPCYHLTIEQINDFLSQVNAANLKKEPWVARCHPGFLIPLS